MASIVTEGYHLSPQQRRLWLLGKDILNLPYRAQGMIVLDGRLDRKILRNALSTLIERYGILRTTFRRIPAMSLPLQVIGSLESAWNNENDVLQVNDQFIGQDCATLLTEIEQQTQVEHNESRATAILYALSDFQHVLHLDLPGFWQDGQGLECMTRELAEVYHCLEHGGQQGDDEPVQYVAVAEWLNALLDGSDAASGRNYWRSQSGQDHQSVPFAGQAEGNHHFRLGCVRHVLDAEVCENIKVLTGDDSSNIQTFLLTCFSSLIWQFTSSDDVNIRLACDGRVEEVLQDVLGLLTKYVPFKVHFASNCVFREVWQQIKDTYQSVIEWQDYFDWHEETPDTSSSSFPLGFDFTTTGSHFRARNLSFKLVEHLACHEPFVIRFSCNYSGEDLNVRLFYNEKVLQQEDAERLASYFSTLVRAAVLKQDERIGEIELLGAVERQYLLSNFSLAQNSELLRKSSLVRAFEKQVEQTPQASALVLQQRVLTYAEVNACANAFAHRLLREGVTPETRIVLCAQQIPDAIVGLLGILKSGGVYVPLDPAYPSDRRSYLLQDSQARLVVVQQKYNSLFDECGIRLVELDEYSQRIPDAEIENPVVALEPESLAYLIYTSGSTGKPKGVAVSHLTAFNHCKEIQKVFGLSEHDRVLQFASLSFDVSLEQTFPALLTGATVVMRGPEPWSPATLNSTLVDEDLTVINLTPVFWQQWTQDMLAEPDWKLPTRLRLIIVGGEAMSIEGLRSWRRTPFGTCQLLNAYGPTEAVITATICVTTDLDDADKAWHTVPIGRPLAHRTAYVLGRNGGLLPIGVPGELYLGGELLARGYLNRPALTAKQFLPDPYAPLAGSRMYRTGDLARYLSDGQIEYLGRVDEQIKIRGFRIEPGEIESILLEHTAVQAALVVQSEDDAVDKRLVAYVIPQLGLRVNPGDLRHFLELKLPRYMIPSAFVMLDAFPLTAHGKIDRRALPAPNSTRQETEEVFIAPRTPVEEQLAAIWCDVLGMQTVGIQDNFFNLGGHSIVATRVISRIRATFHVEAPLHWIFQEPTIRGLAEKIEVVRQEKQEEPLEPPIVRLSRGHNELL